jgi:hypothetical protein
MAEFNFCVAENGGLSALELHVAKLSKTGALCYNKTLFVALFLGYCFNNICDIRNLY